MKFEPYVIHDKLGREVVLRSAEESDAEDLIRYLRVTSAETPYLIREPEEVTMTPEGERAFIRAGLAAPRELMILAVMDGKHIGSCSMTGFGPFQRYTHRCSVAIALYGEYCGCGIGRQMLEVLLQQAKAASYEQAELEVIAGNEKAIGLYEKLGFAVSGRLPNNVKYRDGACADALWMWKAL